MDAEKTNILVVDDLDEKLLAYRTILEDFDQNVVTVKSGEEALRHVLRTDFAVILLDVNMPGMNGFETASLIRARRKSANTPVIFLTAFSDEVRATEGYAHGAVDYISTPVIPKILRAKVRVFVDLYRMTQQVRRQAEERIALEHERTRREAAEESNRRLEFLARAGAVLGQSLDYLVTARDVARLPVPLLAAVATVVVVHPRTGEWAAFVARSGPDGTLDEEAGRRAILPADLADKVDRALAESVAAVEPGDPTVVLPLRNRSRPFGAVALSRSHGEFVGADLIVAEAFAGRAASALENARLYQDLEEANRQKNEFLSMLAHELRNPLAPLRNAVEVIRLKAPDQPHMKWAREVIDRQLKHMVRLVDDLLDVSRITSGKIRLQMNSVNLADVIAQAVEASLPAMNAAGHRFDRSVPKDPVWVRGDAARLTQVVTNLLNNAAKYTMPGGSVRIVLEREKDIAVMRVCNNGIGIPAHMLASIFDLFTQVDRSLDRAQGGLGIGLTLVHRLVALHEGSVTVVSEGVGRGSEFVVRLPSLSQSREDPTAAHVLAPHPPVKRLSVLLVDDHVDGAESLATLLRLIGHDVRLAHDGPTAVALGVECRPDVIVLDIGLPGMSGYDVARQLRTRSETREALLVAITGYGREEDRQMALEAGFDHHLVKPVEVATLEHLLNRSSSADRSTHATIGS